MRWTNFVSKQELEELYLVRHWTMEEIGKHFGKTRARICQLIKKFGIDTSKAERFELKCPFCGKIFEITRKRFREDAMNYCSLTCYMNHRRTIADYRHNRQGLRTGRAVMERHIGRPLLSSEIVHHEDGDNLNNDLSNLRLFSSNAEHMRYHHERRINGFNKSEQLVYPLEFSNEQSV